MTDVVRDAFGLFYRRRGAIIERAYPLREDALRPATFVPVLSLETFVPRHAVDHARLALWTTLR